MKKITLLALLLLVLVGCSQQGSTDKKGTASEKEKVSAVDEDSEKEVVKETAKKEEEREIEKLLPDLSQYETVKLEKKEENFEIEIQYPSFGYEPVDKLLADEMQFQFESSQEAAKEIIKDPAYEEEGLGTKIKYSYDVSFKEPVVTDDFVSIYFDVYIYMGGVHGTEHSYAFNYDLKNNQLLDLEEVLKRSGTDLNSVSKLVAEELINSGQFAEYRSEPVTFKYKEDVKEETKPTLENYYAFSLTEDAIILYKQFYKLFPNSAGVVGVEVSWDKIAAATEEKKNDIVYQNNDHQFTLHLPASWEGKYIVKEGDWNVGAEISYDFQFMHNGKEICNIFSISVLDTESAENIGPMNLIANHNGKTYVWNPIMEMPPEFWEGGELQELEEEFARMVNEEVPEIMETFTFE
ncbi:PdaC/SigV domain-containing protein [Lederbergia galactosidilytica]|uniref:Deacetylase PdaC domain-containing protein n=1 Tax=Lederbergia galactosidilytica TaxID=217031 RepID=A0A177ZHE2_9BACI|nr:DUF4163 domain-containing protein [Lederbergia galactosidilytica]KRG16467.1 hypothetical protein ACA30_01885 [Virgibacillus soli]OAK67342.1 hypothetical protein ABB05_19510 [Lederbergia galactosidilytica]